MSSQLVRIASFAAWPSTAAVSSLSLARSGFKYTGHGESTVCTECQLVIDSWQRGDHPDQVHRQRSPNCPFVQEQLQASDSSISSLATASGTAVGSGSSSAVYIDCTNPDFERATVESARLSTFHTIDGSISAAVSSVVGHSLQNGDVTGRAHRFIATDGGTQQVNHVANMHHVPCNQVPLLCVIDREHPDFDRLKDEEVRLSTFHDWPERAARIIEPRDLAKAGLFYTGQIDRVQCAFCRGFLRNWVQGDRPVNEHRKHFPNCSFVRRLNDVSDGERANLTAISAFSASTSRTNPTQFHSTASQPRTAPLGRPVHPHYAAEQRRVESFRGALVPRGQSVDVLAKAGFFHVGPEDNVRCYFCDGGLKHWQPADEPWTQHQRWFPSCPHLQTRHSSQLPSQHVPHNAVPNRSEARQPPFTPTPNHISSGSNVEYRIEPREIKARLDAPMVQAVIKMGYSRDMVRKAIERRLVSTGDDFPNAHSLLEAIFALEEGADPHTESSRASAAAAAAADPGPVASPAMVVVNSAAHVTSSAAASVTNLAVKSERDVAASQLDITDQTPPPKPKSRKKKKRSNKNAAAVNEASSTDVNTNDASAAPAASAIDVSSSVPTTHMLEENEKMKEERLCKVCMDAEVRMVFLPCGHFVCCVDCAQQLQRCPICRICISGTVRAAIS